MLSNPTPFNRRVLGVVSWLVVLLGIAVPSLANNVMRRIPKSFSDWSTLDAVPPNVRHQLSPDMWNVVDVPQVLVTGIWDIHVDPLSKKPFRVVDLPSRPAWNSSTGVWFELVASGSGSGGDETEVRVSWPASTPIDVDISLFAHTTQPRPRDPTCPPSTCRRFVLVRAIWDAHTRPASSDSVWTDQLPAHVFVRLVYEPVYFGIQSTVPPMIAVLVVVVPLSLFVVAPFALRLLEHAGEGSKEKAS